MEEKRGVVFRKWVRGVFILLKVVVRIKKRLFSVVSRMYLWFGKE